jgi:uncharacterized membrane protein YdfJ with MMPL/SSD domain
VIGSPLPPLDDRGQAVASAHTRATLGDRLPTTPAPMSTRRRRRWVPGR